ncbi:MAG TPA: response regulator transcription factor [Syntrophomonadaceae bacterium]|nr:response regulator transcription factor [Syntrophomonadaceae bacterium]
MVVDDEPKILKVITEFLQSEGFQVVSVDNSEDALKLAKTEEFDLMLLDIMLPQQSGLEVCKQLRQTSSMPIIMLTAKSEEIDKLIGLELGADDYVTKPFSPRELAARIRAVLRRTAPLSQSNATILQIGSIRIDLSRYEGWADGVPLSLTPTELKILHMLMAKPGQVFSRLQILENVFGDIYEGYERSIDTHISNIRKKIDPDSAQTSFIQSVYGVGYKFSEKRDPHDAG